MTRSQSTEMRRVQVQVRGSATQVCALKRTYQRLLSIKESEVKGEEDTVNFLKKSCLNQANEGRGAEVESCHMVKSKTVYSMFSRLCGGIFCFR